MPDFVIRASSQRRFGIIPGNVARDSDDGCPSRNDGRGPRGYVRRVQAFRGDGMTPAERLEAVDSNG